MTALPALMYAALWITASAWVAIDHIRDSSRTDDQQSTWVAVCTEDRIEPAPDYLAECNAILAATQTRKGEL